MSREQFKTQLGWIDSISFQIQIVIFDAITSLTPEDMVDITQHPVEVGANVTDHARSQSGRLTLEGVVSMTPNAPLDSDARLTTTDFTVPLRASPDTRKITLDIPKPPVQLSETGLATAGIAALKSAILGAPRATVRIPGPTIALTASGQVLQQDTPRNRVIDTYDRLLKAMNQHELITIYTAHRHFDDMMIERLAVPRSTADGSSAKFQIDFKEVRTVHSSSVEAPKPVEPRAQRPKNNGSKNVKPDPDPEPKLSVATQIFNALNRFGGGGPGL